MRKSLLKSAAVAVTIGAVAVISSVFAFAAEKTESYIYTVDPANNTNGYFTVSGSTTTSNLQDKQTIGDVSDIAKGKKMDSAATISFTPKGVANMTIYWSGNGSDAATISVNGDDNQTTAKKGEYVHDTYENLTSTCTIKRGLTNTKQSVVYYIKVVDTFDSVDTESIEITDSDLNILVDEEYSLTTVKTPANATSSVEWSSSDTTVATVTEAGVVTGKKAGKADITVTSNGHTDTIKVTVSAQNTTENLVPITAGVYNLSTSADIAAGRLLSDSKILAVSKLLYKANCAYAVGDSENLINGYAVKKGNGVLAVKLPVNFTIKTAFTGGTNERIGYFATADSTDASKTLAKTENKAGYNELTYTNNTESAQTVYILSNETTYVGQIVVTGLQEATYTGTNGLVIVKDNTVYAIGKTNITTPDSVVLKVGNYTSSAQTTVYKNVCDSTGADILGTNKEDGYYYIGVTVTGVTNDAAAEALANSISIE